MKAKDTHNGILTAVAAVVLIVVIGIAGRYDCADEVVYSLPDVVYKRIIEDLGDEYASNIDVCDAYMDNREYYDSLVY